MARSSDYDEYQARNGTERLWNRAKSFAVSGFGKGLFLTAVAVIVGLGLVTGTMGMGQVRDFTVNGMPVTTFEQGATEGIKAGIDFFTKSMMGLGTLLTGGALGALHQSRKEQKELAMAEALQIARDRELMRDRDLSREREYSRSDEKNREKLPAHMRAEEIPDPLLREYREKNERARLSVIEDRMDNLQQDQERERRLREQEEKDFPKQEEQRYNERKRSNRSSFTLPKSERFKDKGDDEDTGRNTNSSFGPSEDGASPGYADKPRRGGGSFSQKERESVFTQKDDKQSIFEQNRMDNIETRLRDLEDTHTSHTQQSQHTNTNNRSLERETERSSDRHTQEETTTEKYDRNVEREIQNALTRIEKETKQSPQPSVQKDTRNKTAPQPTGSNSPREENIREGDVNNTNTYTNNYNFNAPAKPEQTTPEIVEYPTAQQTTTTQAAEQGWQNRMATANNENIFVPGSTVRDDRFAASEMKTWQQREEDRQQAPGFGATV